MGSRMKLLLILLFIGITGTVFVYKKYKEWNRPKVNFLETTPISSLIDEEETKKRGEDTSETLDSKEEKTETSSVFVHVCGAVKKEGVYELMAGSRVVDAIKKAGGLTEKASRKGINQAELLIDGSQIYIPSKEEEASSYSPFLGESAKTNINTATKEELMNLPGIGEKKALDIIQYREENGMFKEIKDIMKIRGIKENLYHKIKEKVTV